MIQRNVEAGHDLCMRINRAQNASIPSPLRAGGSASADHGDGRHFVAAIAQDKLHSI